jgi:hypothetical protein
VLKALVGDVVVEAQKVDKSSLCLVQVVNPYSGVDQDHRRLADGLRRGPDVASVSVPPSAASRRALSTRIKV